MYYDYGKIKSIPITNLVRDLGINYREKRKDALLILCPNSEHKDKKIGSCIATSNEKVNAFNCFACGAKGSVIDFMCFYRNCEAKEAAEKLAQMYNITGVKPVANPTAKSKALFTNGECEALGLKNTVSLKFPKSETITKTETYTLSDFAQEDPGSFFFMVLLKILSKKSFIENYLLSDEAELLRKKGLGEVLTRTMENASLMLSDIEYKLCYSVNIKEIEKTIENNKIASAQ